MNSRRRAPAPLPGWLALVACVAALVLALLNPDALAEIPTPVEVPLPVPAPSGSTISPAPTGSAISPLPAGTTLFAPPPPDDAATRSGRAAMPGDTEVPLEWMPPGTAASPLPSEEIFPPQTIPLRFNHKKHVKQLKLSCKSCHAAAYASNDAADRLLPKPAQACDGCHETDHSDLLHVKAAPLAMGQCSFCHLGAKAGEGGKVAAVVIPTPNLHFPHKKHLARNVQCAQCHGKIDELELAAREQMPRMAGCLTCHAMSGPAQGEARSACTTCHLTQPDGRMQVAFPTGNLVPPRWLHDAGHAADWIDRHKSSAANDSAFCGNCHTDKYCADCHDGKVRPRNIHPNDFLSMHPQAARQDNPRCVSCHQEQTFCADCHRRTGVARDAASGNRLSGRRFHLPSDVWTTAPRGPQHHAWEAERNLNACVSCHTERDCTTCHATKGLGGGQGVNPHPLGFRSKCGLALQRNPRPCLVCHDSRDTLLRELPMTASSRPPRPGVCASITSVASTINTRSSPRHGPATSASYRCVAYSLHSPSGDRYSGGAGFALAPGRAAKPKENEREGADQVPARQHVHRLSGGDYPGYGAQLSPGRRRSRSPAAPLEADRREGRRRHAADPGGLSERAHPERDQRAGHPRADLHLLRVVASSAVIACVALLGCDVDHPGPPPLSPVNLVDIAVATATDGGAPSSYVAIDPHGSTAEVVAKTSFRVTFDRFLLPTSTFRQSVCLQAGVTPVTALKDCANGVFLEPSYDPVRRQITLRQPTTSAGLVPGTHYTLSVFPPPDDGTSNGIEAFDGAPLERAASRTFATRDVEPAGTLPDVPPTVDFCKDLFINVLSSTCASGGCHTSAGPEDHGVALGAAEGLDFSSAAKIQTTAVSHVAHETQTGEHAGTIEVSPSLFGRAMPILDPTRPGNSYALYKLLAGADNGAPGATPALEKQRVAEVSRLREAIVVGMPMPPANGQKKALTQAQLEQISDWIAQGAPTKCP